MPNKLNVLGLIDPVQAQVGWPLNGVTNVVTEATSGRRASCGSGMLVKKNPSKPCAFTNPGKAPAVRLPAATAPIDSPPTTATSAASASHERQRRRHSALKTMVTA